MSVISGDVHWVHPAPGVFRTQVGRRDPPTLTEAASCTAKLGRLQALGAASPPFNLAAVREYRSGERSTISLPLKPGERIYGLGLQMHGMDRRGQVFHLRVDHYATGQDRLHAPTPLYVSSLGYAVLFNSSRPVDVYVGVGNRLDDPALPASRDRNTDAAWDSQPDSGRVEASVQGPGLEVVVFAGPSPMNALQRYNLFCGGGAMPPLWALGFWARTPTLEGAPGVLQEADEYAKRGFPLDVIGLEPGWQSRSYPGTMEWSRERFPDPKGFLEQMEQRGVRTNLWENPYLAPGSSLFREVSPNFGSHTVWLGAVPDLLAPKASQALERFHEEHHLRLGVSGYKIDEIDGFDQWLWPDHASFPSGLDGLRMRQIYGLLWQERIDGWFRKAGRRTFGLIRGSNGGASRFPFALYSDTYDHREYVTASVNSALAGVLWCAEARDATSPEEWVRRIQSACFSPIAQLNAWSSGVTPWHFPSVEAEVRDAMVLRERLAPYFYSMFFQYYDDGIPPIRPMSLVDGGLETNQYLLGDDLLVAPVFAGESGRTVRIPAGDWVEFGSGRAVSGGVANVSLPLGDVPLFVRSGRAMPMLPAGTTRLSQVSGSSPILLRCFGPGPWSGTLYEDDGQSFEFERGEYGLFSIRVGIDHQIVCSPVSGHWKQPRHRLVFDGG